ncbi:hypothetical protein RlegWSM1455_07190 [Rhizobium laguerreae]|uniref:hypothetical protein n=1 Tax=Rhizobium laguerreae TaxID=1076926 RepID=UPI001E29202D|nr:hypothetical protein [Rhizobium laguerreae]UFW65799.1 hypothetical protein RlegWSM1455_07190 [Rhizobium laguerreae]
MKNAYVAALLAATLTACAATTPAASPMEAHLNRYAGAEAVARNCPAYGGYGSIAAMRSDAENNLARARALGAKETDIKQARERMNGQLMSAIFLVGPPDACNSFVNGLAWAGTTPAVVKPKAASPINGKK